MRVDVRASLLDSGFSGSTETHAMLVPEDEKGRIVSFCGHSF